MNKQAIIDRIDHLHSEIDRLERLLDEGTKIYIPTTSPILGSYASGLSDCKPLTIVEAFRALLSHLGLKITITQQQRTIEIQPLDTIKIRPNSQTKLAKKK
jgi:hypothetical protein